MKDVGGAVLAGSSPPFLGRERAAVDVDVGPERRSPRYHWWVFTDDDVYLLRRRLDSVHFFFLLLQICTCLVISKGWCDNDRRRHAQGHFDHQHGLHADDSQQQRAKLHTLE